MTTTTTTEISSTLRPGFWTRFVEALARGVERSARVRSRRARIEALEAKSDAELARLGIRRDEIAYHVFRDMFYA